MASHSEPNPEVTRKHLDRIIYTEFKSIIKDNIATAVVLIATFVAFAGAFIDRAEQAAAQLPIQQMEAITVNASRAEVATLATMLVTASRDARTLVTLGPTPGS